MTATQPDFWSIEKPIVKLDRFVYSIRFASDASLAILSPSTSVTFDSLDDHPAAYSVVRSIENCRTWARPHALALARIEKTDLSVPLAHDEKMFVAAPSRETFSAYRVAIVRRELEGITYVALAVLQRCCLLLIAGTRGFGVVVNRSKDVPGAPLLWGSP